MRNAINYWRLVSILMLSIMILFSLLGQAVGPNVQKDKLIGHWTFEKGVELKELTGHFKQIKLEGASVKDGKLQLGSAKWALATYDKGPDIGPGKTMVVWIYMDDLSVTRGAPLAINKSSADMFDAIVYAERQPFQWMAGSSHFRRTKDAQPGFKENSNGKDLIQLAISYEDDGGNAHVKIYRKGKKIGDYTKGPIRTWVKGDVEVLFGPRALIGGTAYGWVVCRVEDARIYNAVLTQAELKGLKENTLAVGASAKLAMAWASIKIR